MKDLHLVPGVYETEVDMNFLKEPYEDRLLKAFSGLNMMLDREAMFQFMASGPDSYTAYERSVKGESLLCKVYRRWCLDKSKEAALLAVDRAASL